MLRTRYLIIDWSPRRPDGRRWKIRHNRRVSSVYVQALALEVSVWYR